MAKSTKERSADYYARHRGRQLESQRRWRLKSSYGLTLEDYDAMFAEQNGLCACCDEPEPSHMRLAVDHDHSTGKVRALLCSRCNPLLGFAQEDERRLAAAAAYLRRQNR